MMKQLTIFDSHIHIGQFNQSYFEPKETVKSLLSIGVKKWLVSSTSVCDDSFCVDKVRNELSEMINLAPSNTKLLMWVTPHILSISPDLTLFSPLTFSALKIHGYAQHWDPNGKPLRTLFHIAQQRNIPVLVHTGGSKKTDAGMYKNIISDFPEVKVILAHGRPIEQTVEVLQSCPNSYVDTAFMPFENIEKLLEYGFSKRILFGTDFPLDRIFYPAESEIVRYNDRITHIVEKLSPDFFEESNKLFDRLYCKQT